MTERETNESKAAQWAVAPSVFTCSEFPGKFELFIISLYNHTKNAPVGDELTFSCDEPSLSAVLLFKGDKSSKLRNGKKKCSSSLLRSFLLFGAHLEAQKIFF